MRHSRFLVALVCLGVVLTAGSSGDESSDFPVGRPRDLPEYVEGFDELLEVKSFHFTNATVAAEAAADANRTGDSFVLVTVIFDPWRWTV